MRGIVGTGLAGVIGAAVLLAPAGVARADVTELCRFDGERLAEISGLAYSTLHEGIVWAHNDSGGGARLYALLVLAIASDNLGRAGAPLHTCH
jgi:hypothetical protein